VTPPIRKQSFTEIALRSFQDDVIRCFGYVFGLPFLQGGRVVVGATAAGAFSFAHGLARKPSGFFVIACTRVAAGTGDIAVYRRADDTLDATRIGLYTSASFESLTLWVF
jgi:hypothetical protein